jgi:hypothetical protein
MFSGPIRIHAQTLRYKAVDVKGRVLLPELWLGWNPAPLNVRTIDIFEGTHCTAPISPEQACLTAAARSAIILRHDLGDKPDIQYLLESS